MKFMTKLSYIGKEIYAKLTGDDSLAKAIKAERMILSTCTVQIAAGKHKKIKAEVNFENAKEQLKEAECSSVILDVSGEEKYTKGIIEAIKRVKEAEEVLEDIDYNIKLWSEIMEKVSTKDQEVNKED